MNTKKLYSSALLIVLFVFSGVRAWEPPPGGGGGGCGGSCPAPGSFSLDSPDNDSTIPLPSEHLTLSWHESTGADLYYVYISTSETFNGPEGWTTNLSWNIDSENLQPGQTYYWHVTAVNDELNCCPTARGCNADFHFTIE